MITVELTFFKHKHNLRLYQWQWQMAKSQIGNTIPAA